MGREVVGIDLGGASSRTTGWVRLAGDVRPRVEEAALLKPGRSPAETEEALLAKIVSTRPEALAIDAPLTLPPCLTCRRECSGRGSECREPAARWMWTAGYNPVSERPCEAYVREVVGERPLPTMQLGSITARAIVLARRLEANDDRWSAREGRVLEVYPRATLRSLAASDHRLRPRQPKEPQEQFRARIVAGLQEVIDGLEAWPETREIGHVLDALISAYTAWLWPSSLRAPPRGWPFEEGGWIWFPLSNDQQAHEPEVALSYARENGR